MGGLQSIQNYYPSCLTSTIQGVSSTLSLTCISFHLKHQNTLTVLRESFVDLGVLEFQLGQKLKSLHFQLFHLDLLHFSDLFFPGCLLLLHKDGVSLGHPPVVRTRHGRAEGSSTCRLHVLPVSSPCASPSPLPTSCASHYQLASFLLSPLKALQPPLGCDTAQTRSNRRCISLPGRWLPWQTYACPTLCKYEAPDRREILEGQ